MGLPKGKLSLTRKQVEKGKVGAYEDEEFGLYARHDKPDEVLESDSKYPEGHNPVQTANSPANK